MRSLVCQRSSFSIPEDVHYLNCAYLAPLSTRVRTVALEALDALQTPWRVGSSAYFDIPNLVRAKFATLIGARDARRVALVPSVSYGMAVACKNLRSRAGQNVVVIGDEFPSAVLAWRRYARENSLELRTVPAPPDARDTGGLSRSEVWTAALLSAIDRDTSAVVLAILHWSDGTLFDVDAISDHARRCGAMVVIDGTQSIGALPFDVERVQPDMLVVAGYKWLMGAYGLSVAYFGPRFDRGEPIEDVWTSQVDSENFAGLASYRDTYRAFGEQYDGGQRASLLLAPMLAAAIDQLLEWRPERIQAYCAQLLAPWAERLHDLGIEMAPTHARAAHLIGLRLPQHVANNASTIVANLSAQRIHVSLRGSAIRVAPHVYNTSDDVRALCDALEFFCRP